MRNMTVVNHVGHAIRADEEHVIYKEVAGDFLQNDAVAYGTLNFSGNEQLANGDNTEVKEEDGVVTVTPKLESTTEE